jgi:SAM-dependent methyltransferase
MTDDSNGYEEIADLFIKGRGAAENGIGSSTIRVWARSLKRGSVILDIGCGTGIPVTKILVEEGMSVFALDASPTMTAVFQRNFPGVSVVCESVENSSLFNRSFDSIIAVGIVFLLSDEKQRALIPKMAAALNPGGRLLFTAPLQKLEWKDIMTGQRSRSLGAEQYRALITESGLTIVGEFDDEGENHYFDAEMIGEQDHLR